MSNQILTPNGNPIVARWSSIYQRLRYARLGHEANVSSLVEELSDMTAAWQTANEAITAVEQERNAARAELATERGRVIRLLRELNAFKTGHHDTQI